MSLQGIFDPIVRAYFKKKYGGGGGESEPGYYDAFWDAYQQNGTKTAYNQYAGGFLGPGWTDENFHPKYPIAPTDGSYIFRATNITDLTKPGISLDFSNSTVFNYAFAFSSLVKLPLIDMSRGTNTTSAFSSYIGSDLSICVSENTKTDNTTFTDCKNLQNLTVSGTIGQTFNLQWSPLTPESMKSVITHLKNYAGTSNAYTYSFTVSDSCWTNLEADSTAPHGGTWRDYVETVLCWNT